MSQPNGTCQDCKKAWLPFHTFKSFRDDGLPELQCSRDELPMPDPFVRYIMSRASRIAEARATITRLEEEAKQSVLDRQADDAELRRKHKSEVEAAANGKFEKLRAEFEAQHKAELKKAQDELERIVAENDAAKAELSTKLKVALTAVQTLRQENTDLAAKLNASERKAGDLQMEVDELAASLTGLQVRHQGLKDRSLDIVRLLISMGTRVMVLEEKTGVIPKVDPKRIYEILTEQEYDDADVPVDELRNDPTPVPPPRAPEAVPMAAAAAPEPQTVTFDDLPPPSTDDEGDHDIIEEEDLDEDEDEEEPSGAMECSGCTEAATEELTYVTVGGSEEILAACNPAKHAAAFLSHLKRTAKSPPKDETDLICQFNPIS